MHSWQVYRFNIYINYEWVHSARYVFLKPINSNWSDESKNHFCLLISKSFTESLHKIRKGILLDTIWLFYIPIAFT